MNIHTWLNERGKSQGTKNIKEFSFTEQMQKQIDEVLSNYVPNFPKQVELMLPTVNLPKLQKVVDDNKPKLTKITIT